jgi:hypothetical protein
MNGMEQGFQGSYLKEICDLMTPDQLLSQSEFEKPEAINPYFYTNFEKLLMERERIRHLQLVPVKSDEEYLRYHRFSKEFLTDIVRGYIYEAPLNLKVNLFRYDLPDDLLQEILWIRNWNESRLSIAEFLEGKILERKLTTDKIILFERPVHTGSRLVRGTVPEYRHIHFWTKIL